VSKQQQLIEYVIQDIIRYQIEDMGLSVPESMSRFYTSTTFSKLQDVETGLYLNSSAYVYDLFKVESEQGMLTQNEI
jgi:hypothetical protein